MPSVKHLGVSIHESRRRPARRACRNAGGVPLRGGRTLWHNAIKDWQMAGNPVCLIVEAWSDGRAGAGGGGGAIQVVANGTGRHRPSSTGRGCATRAPFPWYGGKRRWAELIWSKLGNPGVYAEPFAGSLAVLLHRTATLPARDCVRPRLAAGELLAGAQSRPGSRGVSRRMAHDSPGLDRAAPVAAAVAGRPCVEGRARRDVL